ncbi:MAG: metallopeptidase family protein [Deltaproteobacteria bacterium]|nr:metallopeptidase family protein [Deltaproteobacteria bacterium]
MPEDTGQPGEVTRLLDLAWEELEAEDLDAALLYCEQALALDPHDADAWYCMGECRMEGREPGRALDAFRRAVLSDPTHSDAWVSLGNLHLMFRQHEESRRAFNRALREDPDNPEAWFGRAMLRERRGDWDGADRDLARAARIDSESWPFPLPLTDEDLEGAVEEAVRSLHPSLREYIANVAILVDEVPSDEILSQYDPPIWPGELLGTFTGYSLMERSTEDPWSQLPSSIVLFRRNLQRFARNRETLVEELRITIYHEVGHFLGLDEDDLKERGLD